MFYDLKKKKGSEGLYKSLNEDVTPWYLYFQTQLRRQDRVNNKIPLLKDTWAGGVEGRIESPLRPLFSVRAKTHTVENSSSSSEPEMGRSLKDSH